MMSLPFDLPRGKGLRDDSPLQPYKIVSLWELMEFFKDAGKLYSAALRLSVLLPAQQYGIPDRKEAIPLEQYSETKDRIDFLCEELERIQFVYALDCANELRRVIYEQIKEGPTPEPGRWMVLLPEVAYRYRMHARDLAKNLQRELSNRIVMFFSAQDARHYDEWQTIFPQNVRDAFPSAEQDMEEAAKCFAFQRNTAVVFHLMRVMEVGLYVLGEALGRSAGKNWHMALQDIGSEITKRNATPPQGWKADQPFYSEAATHFRMVKEPWRNYTMHIKAHYDASKAKDIFNSVSAFMRHLATKLHEEMA